MNWQARPQALASAIRETPQSVQRPGRAAPDRRGASSPAVAVMRLGVPPGPRQRPQGRCLPAGAIREYSGKKGLTGRPPMTAQHSRCSPWYSPENRRPGSGFLPRLCLPPTRAVTGARAHSIPLQHSPGVPLRFRARAASRHRAQAGRRGPVRPATLAGRHRTLSRRCRGRAKPPRRSAVIRTPAPRGIDRLCQVSFDLTGTIDSLKLVVDNPQLSDADKARLEAAMKKAAD